MIYKIKEGGILISDPAAIRSSAATYFESLFSGEPHQFDQLDVSCSERVLSDFDGDALCQVPAIDELKIVVFSMHPNSVARPDGFSALFPALLGYY